jgi:hypothetical protein
MIPADSNTNKLKTVCFKLFMTVCSMEGKSSDTTVGSLDLQQSHRFVYYSTFCTRHVADLQPLEEESFVE